MNNTIAYTLINGKDHYKCYGLRHTSHGRTCLFKTEGGNWIVANGVNWFTPLTGGVVRGDWNHGHYFMEHKEEALAYFKEVM